MKKGDKVICIKNFDIYSKINDILLIKYQSGGAIDLVNTTNNAFFSILIKIFPTYFLTLEEFREKRINEILK